MTIIGYRDFSFKTEDGKEIAMTTLYLGYPIKEHGDGYGVGRVHKVNVSAKMLGDYEPTVGDEIVVNYNAYGKIRSIEAV